MPRKPITISSEHYQDIVARLDSLQKTASDITTGMAVMETKVGKVEKHDEMLAGNGKPGFLAIRDKVLNWEAKGSAIFFLIVGDVILRVLQITVFK